MKLMSSAFFFSVTVPMWAAESRTQTTAPRMHR